MKSDRSPAMFAQASVMPNMPGMMPGMMPMPGMLPGMMPQTQVSVSSTDMERRLEALERQVRRLDTRITRLETPLGTQMGPQLGTQPYNTSIPMQDNQAGGFQNPTYIM